MEFLTGPKETELDPAHSMKAALRMTIISIPYADDLTNSKSWFCTFDSSC